MAQTLFRLGFEGSSAPWAYQPSLGISLSDLKDWWTNNQSTVTEVAQGAQKAGVLPGGMVKPPAPPPTPAASPMPRPQLPASSSSSGTTILVALLLAAGAGGAYYFYMKQKKGKNGKAAKA